MNSNLFTILQNTIVYCELIGSNRFKVNAIINFCGKYFYKTETTSMRYKHLRTEYIRKLLIHVFFVLLLMMLSYLMVFAFPIYESIFEHIRVTPVGVNLPFLEKNSNTEFTINLTVQIIMACYSAIAGFSMEIASCTINHVIVLVPKLIRLNLLEFQDEFEKNGMNVKSRAQLRNAYIQLQDYDRFERFLLLFLI